MEKESSNHSALFAENEESIWQGMPVNDVEAFVQWSFDHQETIYNATNTFEEAIQKDWLEILSRSWAKGDVSLVEALTKKGWNGWYNTFLDANKEGVCLLDDLILEYPIEMIEKVFKAAQIKANSEHLIAVLNADYSDAEEKFERVDALISLGANINSIQFEELIVIIEAKDIGPLLKRGYAFPKTEKECSIYAPPLTLLTIKYSENVIETKELNELFDQHQHMRYQGMLPIHWLAHNDDKEARLSLLKFMLKKGVDINTISAPIFDKGQGKTLLFMCVEFGHFEFAETLLSMGAGWGGMKNLFMEMGNVLQNKGIPPLPLQQRFEWMWKKGVQPSELEWECLKSDRKALHPYIQLRMEELVEFNALNERACSTRSETDLETHGAEVRTSADSALLTKRRSLSYRKT